MFRHFRTPILLFESSFSGFDSLKCQFVLAFYEVDSSSPEFDSWSCLFDSSVTTSTRRFCIVGRFGVSSFRRFDMAFPYFDLSTLVGYNSLQNT